MIGSHYAPSERDSKCEYHEHVATNTLNLIKFYRRFLYSLEKELWVNIPQEIPSTSGFPKVFDVLLKTVAVTAATLPMHPSEPHAETFQSINALL